MFIGHLKHFYDLPQSPSVIGIAWYVSAGRIFGLCNMVNRIYKFIIIQFSQFLCPIFSHAAEDSVLTHFTMLSVSWTVQCQWLVNDYLERNWKEMTVA